MDRKAAELERREEELRRNEFNGAIFELALTLNFHWKYIDIFSSQFEGTTGRLYRKIVVGSPAFTSISTLKFNQNFKLLSLSFTNCGRVRISLFSSMQQQHLVNNCHTLFTSYTILCYSSRWFASMQFYTLCFTRRTRHFGKSGNTRYSHVINLWWIIYPFIVPMLVSSWLQSFQVCFVTYLNEISECILIIFKEWN